MRRRHLRLGPEEEAALTKGGDAPHATTRRCPVGLGLRWELEDELLARRPSTIDVLEVSPENYVGRGGAQRAALDALLASYPVITHGLTLGLGGTEPLDGGYLEEVRDFVREMGSPWHSDHLCFSVSGGRVLHDLLPIALTRRAVVRVADRVRRAQDALGVPLAVENISYYLEPVAAELSEADFLAEVAERADCGILLDLNNAHVNAHNFGFDVRDWLGRVPLERVVQIHVAGPDRYDDSDSLLVDTHASEVPDGVLSWLEVVLPRTGPVPVVLERDQRIPPLEQLLVEVDRVRAACERAAAV